MLMQTDWIVHGSKHQGLYAWCYLDECMPKTGTFSIFILIIYIISNLSLWFSVFLSLPYLLCTNYAKPIEISAKIQLFAGMLINI